MKGGGRETKQDAATTETAIPSPFAIRSTNKFHSGDMFLDERRPSSDTRWLQISWFYATMEHD